MEVWGGIECSVNRVANSYFDQLSYDGIYQKPALLMHAIALGIKTMRFPVLWETNWPDQALPPQWAVEKHLELLKHHQVNVVAGLVHHGSGPSYAKIGDPHFPECLASYAKKVAEKFPWIADYTPINEPLTTARFCGLYGLWYPHSRNSSVFLQLLLNECKATVLAMKAIRLINPHARLIFTEDLTRIHGSKELQAQIDFENHRRWLSVDLICGKVNENHPLWNYLISEQVNKTQLDFFLQQPCPPDVLGFNYYVTSERYLDHELEKHSLSTHGGNGFQNYADIEAVRHPQANLAGIKSLLAEAYHRYQIPLAVTEAHLCCGREDQLRWLSSIWNACKELVHEEVPVVAVTFWSLFGAYGWDKLLTSAKGAYEPGAFDLRSGSPRATAIAHFIAALARNKRYHHPLLHRPGWWQSAKIPPKLYRPILIIGGSGTLGTAFKNCCTVRNINFIAPDRKVLDILKLESIQKTISHFRPWAVINAAGYVNVDRAEKGLGACFLANTIGAINLAKSCKLQNIQLVTFSSDLVFDGGNEDFYLEDHPLNPLNVYGQSKAAAENEVLAIDLNALIIRTSAFFGPWDQYNFVKAVLNNLKEGRYFKAMADVYITATYLPHLTHATIDLLIDKEKGIWHLANVGKISWYDFAKRIAVRAGYSSTLIRPILQADLAQPARRPVNSALASSKGKLMPNLEKGLGEFFEQLQF